MIASSRNQLQVLTPEGVALTFPLAGVASRFFAWFIDAFVISAVISVVAKLLAVFSVVGLEWNRAASIIVYFVLSTGYGIFLEWQWRGQTVGKRLLHLRVMDVQGLHLTFSQIAIRNLFRSIDGLPVLYFVGGLVSILNKRAQRLGDLAANTVVIRHQRIAASETRLTEVRFNSLAEHMHVVARIRHKASPDLLDVAFEAIARRDQLSDESRVALFSRIRSQFELLSEFPEDAVAYLSDEQYVRNLLAAMVARKPHVVARSAK